MMSLLHGSPTTSANDPIPWIRFPPFPRDLPALRLHADEPHRLRIMLERSHHPRSDQDDPEAPHSTLPATVVEDGLRVQRQATGAVLLAAVQSHDHPIHLEGNHTKTTLNASRPRHGTRAIQETGHSRTSLGHELIPGHLAQVPNTRIIQDPEVTDGTEIDRAVKIVGFLLGTNSGKGPLSSALPSLHESVV